MNRHTYQIERNGKFTTVRSTNDALGAARGLYPDIGSKKIIPAKNGHVTKIGDITVTEIDPFLGETSGVVEAANSPGNYQSAINAVADAVARNVLRGKIGDSLNYVEVLSIIYGFDEQKIQKEIETRIQQKISKLKQRRVYEGACKVCGGDGWYVEPDEKGEPKQVQCDACQGQGGHKDPEPRLRPSGEPENEPFFESTKPIKLSEILSGGVARMTLNGKPINTKSIEIEDVDPSDFPDFVDAFISYAEYSDGTALTDEELEALSDQEGEWINSTIHDDQLYL